MHLAARARANFSCDFPSVLRGGAGGSASGTGGWSTIRYRALHVSSSWSAGLQVSRWSGQLVRNRPSSWPFASSSWPASQGDADVDDEFLQGPAEDAPQLLSQPEAYLAARTWQAWQTITKLHVASQRAKRSPCNPESTRSCRGQLRMLHSFWISQRLIWRLAPGKLGRPLLNYMRQANALKDPHAILRLEAMGLIVLQRRSNVDTAVPQTDRQGGRQVGA